MKTMTLQSKVDGDGTLRLEVPCDLPPGPVEVVVVVHPTAPAVAQPASLPAQSARSGLFVGKGPRSVDLDAMNNEMNSLWKAKLAALEP